MDYSSKYFTEQITLMDAIQSLHPDAAFGIIDDDIDQIHWQSEDIPQPSKEEILAEQARLQAIRDTEYYKKNRALEYPSIAEQLDLLYHVGYDGWKAAIDVIKEKYPKP